MLFGLVLAARPAAKAAAAKAARVRRDAVAAPEVHGEPGSRHERDEELAEWHGRVARSVALQAATEQRHLRRGRSQTAAPPTTVTRIAIFPRLLLDKGLAKTRQSVTSHL